MTPSYVEENVELAVHPGDGCGYRPCGLDPRELTATNVGHELADACCGRLHRHTFGIAARRAVALAAGEAVLVVEAQGGQTRGERGHLAGGVGERGSGPVVVRSAAAVAECMAALARPFKRSRFSAGM
jgi:hypothetical protein